MDPTQARPRALVGALLLCLPLGGCAAPPPSQFPTADDALARMHATYECSRGVKGEAKVDYFGDDGRVRGDVSYTAALPESVRLDVTNSFAGVISTLTADGTEFTLLDKRNRQFLRGPATACNLARFLGVPVPPHALVQLLRGEAPVLVHQPDATSIAWENGRYVLRIRSKHQAVEQIHLEPVDADWNKPWEEQRVRVLEVRVTQQDAELYRAEMSRHRAGRMAGPRVDPDGLNPDIPPSGPQCTAEIPRAIRLLVPHTDKDVLLTRDGAEHNPPLFEGQFTQVVPAWATVRYSPCAD